MRVVKYYNRLSREVVDAQSLEKMQSHVGWGSEHPDLVKDAVGLDELKRSFPTKSIL